MIGSLVYAMTFTRSDLSYCVTKLSQNLSNPDNSNWIILKHVLRYKKHTVDYKLTFQKSPIYLRLFTYCDTVWASSLDDRRSISGYCISVNTEGPPVSWKSKKQTSVALSTCEAEYMSLSLACQELKYLTKLFTDVVPQKILPALIKSANQGAIALIKSPVRHSSSKHIDIRFHFIHECYKENIASVDYVSSAENVADIFTKPPKKNTRKDFGP